MKLQLPPPMQFNAIGNTTALEFSGYLTPDALMAYCETRLRGLDDQMQKAFEEQQKSNAAQELLGKLQADIHFAVPDHTLDVSLKNGNGFPNNPNDYNQLKNAYDTLEAKIKTLDPRDPLAQKLTQIANNLGSDKSGSFVPSLKSMTTDDWNSMVTGALSSAAKDLSSSSELSMINLQSLMSQRQQAIQVCTNLVQSLGDQCNKIAENVGH